MNETDNPLKRLVHTSIVDFAEWLLDAEVSDVRTANVELPIDPDPIKADQLFWITLVGGTEVLLHIEFQGKSTHKPMRFRMLDYIARLVDLERDVRIHSVIFYIGDGVGAQDTGRHQIHGLNNQVTLSWHYDVIHLWKLTPEDLLNLKRPGLLPLIGQTRIENPEQMIPQVFEEIKAVPNEEARHRLLIELVALLTDERIIDMVENLIEREEWVLDTPFLRRMRRQTEEALHKGLEEGRQQGRLEGRQYERRQSILDLMLLRYDPHASDYFQIEKTLSSIWSNETLVSIFKAAASSVDFTVFANTLEDLIKQDSNINEPVINESNINELARDGINEDNRDNDRVDNNGMHEEDN